MASIRTRDLLRRPSSLIHEVAADLRNHDVLLAAAGLTFYALVAVVPLLFAAFWLSSLLVGGSALRSLGATTAHLLGEQNGLGQAVQSLIAAASRARPAALVSATLIAALYGEGLSRALARFAKPRTSGRGLRGRLAAPALIATTTVLLTLGLLLARGLTDALGRTDELTIFRVYLAFVICWVGLTVNVSLCYSVFNPTRLSRRGLLWGAAGSASWIAGSALGFLLVLSWPLQLGAPFAGSGAFGLAAMIAVWLYFSHTALLLGYASALRLSGDTP